MTQFINLLLPNKWGRFVDSTYRWFIIRGLHLLYKNLFFIFVIGVCFEKNVQKQMRKESYLYKNVNVSHHQLGLLSRFKTRRDYDSACSPLKYRNKSFPFKRINKGNNPDESSLAGLQTVAFTHNYAQTIRLFKSSWDLCPQRCQNLNRWLFVSRGGSMEILCAMTWKTLLCESTVKNNQSKTVVLRIKATSCEIYSILLHCNIRAFLSQKST